MNQQKNSKSLIPSQTQVPLWQLCTKSLSQQTSMKQIRQFLYSLKPQRIESIEKRTILQRILNLLIVIEIITLDRLIWDQTDWGLAQYLFIVFLFFKFLCYAQKRSSKDQQFQKQTFIHQKQQLKDQSKQLKDQRKQLKDQRKQLKDKTKRLNSLSQLQSRNIERKLDNRVQLIFQWSIMSMGYLLYSYIQGYLYIPKQTKMVLFTIMIILTEGCKNYKSSIKLSQVMVLSHKFNSYWIGLICLIINNKYDLVFERQKTSIRHQQAKVQRVQIVYGISAGLMLVQLGEFDILWSLYLVFLWIFVNLIQNIDAQCISLKKKYKDEGLMVQIPQYH